MFVRLSLVTLVLAVFALGIPVKRDAVKVEGDMQNLNELAQELGTSVDNFSGGVPELFAIHMAAMNLDTSLKQTTKDTTASDPFTDAEADTMDQLIAASVPIIQEGLKDFEDKKSAISTSMPGADSIAKADLKSLKSDFDALGGAVVSRVPADKKSVFRAHVNAINSALVSAIKTYST